MPDWWNDIAPLLPFDCQKKIAEMPDWYDDIAALLSPTCHEKMGFPTQKPIALLKRIIDMASNKGDIIADFFCGCGTAIDAAQDLNRRWLGFDACKTACETMQKRMEKQHSLFVGINKKPMTYEDFQDLNPFEFEKTAVRYVGGIPNDKQVSDGGIDGRLAYDGTPIQVKQHKNPIGNDSDLRAFYEPLKQHGRGIFISLNGYTKQAKQKANEWRSENLDIQLLTIQNVIDGKYNERPAA